LATGPSGLARSGPAELMMARVWREQKLTGWLAPGLHRAQRSSATGWHYDYCKSFSTVIMGLIGGHFKTT
jgi:hypothetical protein